MAVSDFTSEELERIENDKSYKIWASKRSTSGKTPSVEEYFAEDPSREGSFHRKLQTIHMRKVQANDKCRDSIAKRMPEEEARNILLAEIEKLDKEKEESERQYNKRHGHQQATGDDIDVEIVDNNSNSDWPREVIDIEKLEKITQEFKKHKVDFRSVLDSVLANSERRRSAEKTNLRRRFVRILGSVYGDEAGYSDDAKTKHLAKLRKHYDQQVAKTRNDRYNKITLENATFYCDLLSAIREELERKYSGIDLPTISVGKPYTEDELKKLNEGKETTRRQPGENKKKKDISLKDVRNYDILDTSKLHFVTKEQLHAYCMSVYQGIDQKRGLKTHERDQLLEIISEIENAYRFSSDVGGDEGVRGHTENIRKKVAYSTGSALTKEKQELYIEFLDKLKFKIQAEIDEGTLEGKIELEQIPILYDIRPEPDPKPDPVLDGLYTSDEWNQMLVISSATAANQAAHIVEGVAVTALKDVLGKDFPEKWEEMTLDQQEEFIKNLSPAQTSKFNIRVIEEAEKLAETMPPSFLTVMAEGIDKSLASKKIKEEEKKSLEEQRSIIIKAMCAQINQAPNNIEIDPENAVGVEAGFAPMIEYLEKNKDNLPEGAKPDKVKVKTITDAIKLALDKYDELNGLTNVDENSADAILESYTTLQKDVKKVLKDKSFEDLLDEDTKKIFNSLEFPETENEKGEKASAEENKKLFIDTVVNIALQKTAVSNHGKNNEELMNAFKEQLAESVVMESAALIVAQESINTANGVGCKFDAKEDPEKTKKKLKDYIGNLSGGKISISKDALAGYYAATVNKQSLFTTRLAKKFKNKSAAILKKMWAPFQKIDKTCIKRFGKSYTIPKAILKNQLKNLP